MIEDHKNTFTFRFAERDREIEDRRRRGAPRRGIETPFSFVDDSHGDRRNRFVKEPRRERESSFSSYGENFREREKSETTTKEDTAHLSCQTPTRVHVDTPLAYPN